MKCSGDEWSEMKTKTTVAVTVSYKRP